MSEVRPQLMGQRVVANVIASVKGSLRVRRAQVTEENLRAGTVAPAQARADLFCAGEK
jgi:hypothetical protein